MSARKSYVVETLRRAQLVELLSKGKRLDGRGLSEPRKLEIQTGLIEKANGSAMVNLGNTQVIAGVKVDKGTPFPDTPDKGLLVVGAEVLPLAASYVEAGPPDESAIELARVVDRGVRESEMIDLRHARHQGRQVRLLGLRRRQRPQRGREPLRRDELRGRLRASDGQMPKFVMDGDSVKNTGEKMPIPVSKIPVSLTMASISELSHSRPDRRRGSCDGRPDNAHHGRRGSHMRGPEGRGRCAHRRGKYSRPPTGQSRRARRSEAVIKGATGRA